MLALQNKQKRTSTPTIRQPLLSNLSPRRYSQSREPPVAPPLRNPLRTSAIRNRYNELDQESNYSDTQKEQHRSTSASRQNGDKYSVLRSPLVMSHPVKRSNSPSRAPNSAETIHQGDNSIHSSPLIVYDQPYSQRVTSRSPSPRSHAHSELTNQKTHHRTRSASPASSVGYENVGSSSISGTEIVTNIGATKKSSLSLSDQDLYKKRKQSDDSNNKYSSYQNLSYGSYSLVQNESLGNDISHIQNTTMNRESVSPTRSYNTKTEFGPVCSSSSARYMSNDNAQAFNSHGSELVMMYDFNDESRGGLNVKRGDLIYANGADQQGTDWLWVFYAPTSQYGYVPRNYVKSTQLKTAL